MGWNFLSTFPEISIKNAKVLYFAITLKKNIFFIVGLWSMNEHTTIKKGGGGEE